MSISKRSHPIEVLVEVAVRPLSYGAVRGWSHSVRGDLWRPSEAEFLQSEVDYSNGDKLVLSDSADGCAVDYVLSSSDGAVLDSGRVEYWKVPGIISGHVSLMAL